MAISYVGGQTIGRANSSAASAAQTIALTGGSNATPATGDLVLINVTSASQGLNQAMAITTPSGYTALGQLNQAAVTGDTSTDVSYKIQGGTPDTTITLPGSGSNNNAQTCTIQVFRGVDSSTPMDVTPVSAGGTATARCDPGAITPVTAGAWVVICGSGAVPSVGPAVYTAPTNYATNFLTIATVDTNSSMVGSGYYTGWTSGAENPGTYGGGTTGANDSWCAYTIALRPSTTPAATASVSQLAAETITRPTPDARLSGLVVETILSTTLSAGPPLARVSQLVAETITQVNLAKVTQLVVETLQPATTETLVTQLVAETVIETPLPPIRVSQAPLELLEQVDPAVQVSQAAVENLQQLPGAFVAARVSQAAVEIIYPFGCYIYVPPPTSPCPTEFPIDDAGAGGSCATSFPTGD